MLHPSRQIRSHLHLATCSALRPLGTARAPLLQRAQNLRSAAVFQRRLHQDLRCRGPSTPPHSPRHPRSHLKRTGIDPTVFLLAAAVSAGIAYLYTTYPGSSSAFKDQSVALEASQLLLQVPAVHDDSDYEAFFHVMAPNTAPGRPGTLTADQTEKLKEMWGATLEVFGVVEPEKEGASNGTSTPSEADSKKKDGKKKRFSLLKKKGDKSSDSNAAAGSENDKHGQTKVFQEALASQSPEELRQAFWSMAKHDHPDALLLRFLRARKWDVQAALIMMVSTMHWRSKEMHVDDDIMVNGEERAFKDAKSASGPEKKEAEDLMAQLRMGKSFLHGQDKDGRPCCYVRVRLHRQGEQSEKSLERFTVYTIESARMLLRPPVDTATIVFDMTDFSMANMDYTPVKFMIKCFEANYPESLGSVLVYKAPWLFNQIWKIIKGWLDPVVAQKVHFCTNVDELSEWIPKSRIMKELGGDEAYTYTYVEPSEGENTQMQDHSAKTKWLDERTELVKSYEGETVNWVQGQDQGEGRTRLAQRLAENYWKLDPYVRARSLYDRTGVIGQDGKLDFYPKAAGGSAGGDAAADDGVD
ncbi:CRAL/TRIO domain-containing protein [Hortaea werneckii]|nr:CRAL/TRIO domain-containing protein [Hortaea werneckii]